MLYQSAYDRSKKKNILFEISIEDIIELWVRQEGKCALTKLDMSLEAGSRDFANDFGVSLDQIVPKAGYTKDNIQLVCRAVNQIKWNRSEDSFYFWIEKIYNALSKGQSAGKSVDDTETFNDYPERE